MNKRLLVLCTLIMALVVGLSASNSAASLWGGEATNLDENGICTWRCYDGGFGRGPAASGPQCVQLCESHCGPPCIPRY
jgi:hypothetical protein